MAGYTDPFGGSAIYPAQTAFRAVTLAANTQLSWPSVATDENYVARSMRVNATSAGLSLTMPDATAVSPGFDVIFTNSGANTYTVRDNAGVAICTVATGQSQYVQLTGNGTAAGTWLTLQFGASSSTATASALAGAGMQVDPSDANRLSPKRTVLAFTDAARVITASTDLGALLDWTSGTATWAPGAGSNASTMGSGFFFGLRNSGTGTLSFDGGGSQIDDLATLTLQPGEACEVVSNGTEWRTIGLGRSNSFAFSRLSKAVNPSGAFSLTAAECANNIHRFTGSLSGNVTVTYQPVTQVYFVQNSTTGAFTVTLTTGSGTTQALSAGQSMVVVCDGTNMIDATTVTVGGFANGSAASPSIFFTSDTNTGIYRVGADQLGFATGGVLGALVDSGQRLLLGPTTSRSVGGAARKLQLEAASADIAASIVRNSNDASGPVLAFGKSRATALGGVTVAQLNDDLGAITWAAADGAALTDSGSRVWASYAGGVGVSQLNLRGGGLAEIKASSTATAYYRVYNNVSGFSPLGQDPASYGAGFGTYFFAGGSSADPCGFQVDNAGAGTAGYFFSGISASGLDDGGTLGVRLKGLTGLEFAGGGGSATYGAMNGSGTWMFGGSTTERTVFGAPRGLQIENATTTSKSSISVVRPGNDSAGPIVVLGKTRSTTLGGSTAVQAGDVLGNLSFVGADGTDMETPGANIQAVVDGTPGANDMPTRLEFYTTADGSASSTLRVQINSAGITTFGTGTATGDAVVQVTNGVRFGGTTSTDSRTLDDYLEGTFTPVLTGSTSGTVNLGGRYRKIGDTAFVWVLYDSAIAAATLVGNLSITGLPYTPAQPISVSIPWIRGSTDPTANVRFALAQSGTTTLNLHSTATWGDVAASYGAAPTFPAANIVQNGVTSVQLRLEFAYLVV